MSNELKIYTENQLFEAWKQSDAQALLQMCCGQKDTAEFHIKKSFDEFKNTLLSNAIELSELIKSYEYLLVELGHLNEYKNGQHQGVEENIHEAKQTLINFKTKYKL